MLANLVLLLIEVALLGSLLLALHRISPRFGLIPMLAVMLGLTVFVQAASATLVYIQISPAIFLVLASTAYVPAILLAVLVLYVVEGTLPARAVIFSILGASILYQALFLSNKLHLSLPGGGSFMGLTPDSQAFFFDWQGTLASLVAFAGDLLIIVIVYQIIRNFIPRLPAWIAPGLALLISLWSDTISYQVLCCGLPGADFLAQIADDLLGKTLAGLMLWPLAALYLTRVVPAVSGFRAETNRPVFDLFIHPLGSLEVALARSEASLQESAALYQSLVEVLPMSVCRKDLQGRFTFVNRRYCERFNLQPGQILGKTDYDVHPQDLAEKYRQDDRDVISGGKTVEFVEEHEPLGRERVAIQVFKTPLYNVKGVADGIQIVFWDITEHRRAEENLRIKDVAIESAISALALADLQGRLSYVNQAFLNLWGYAEKDDVLGREVSQFWEDESQAIGVMLAVANEGRWAGEMRGKRKDGMGVEIQVQAHIVADKNNQPLCLYASFADITERKQAEAREARRRAMLEKVIDLGKTITQITNPQQCLRAVYESVQKGLGFDRVGLFLYDAASGQVRRALGTSRAGEMEDNTDKDGTPLWPARSETEHAAWQRVLNDPRGLRVTDDFEAAYNPGPENEMRGVKQHARLAAWAGEKPVALIAVDNLITQRPFNAEQLEALQLFAGYAGLAIQNAHWNTELERRVSERTSQLEAANHELESLSYTIGHDLRSPIRAIVAYSHLLLDDHSGPLAESQRQKLQHVNQESLRMGSMVDDFLAFLRLSHLPLQKNSVEVESLVRQVLLEFEGKTAGRNVEFSFLPMPDCLADARMLKEVYFHLVSNAIKFTIPRETARIEIGFSKIQGQGCYFVRDNGVGFDMKYVGKLFGVFQRLHHVDEFDGTGAGLAIVQRIIQRHGGRIWAEAEVDKGATFFFTLP